MRKAKSYSQAFKKALTQSITAHIILLLIALIAFRNQTIPTEQEPIDIVMVEITRGNSDELGDTPPEVQHLPENTIEEQKNPMPDAKDAITTAPTRVETATTPPAVDSKTMKEPEKAVKKPQPSGVNAQMAAALAKINNQLRKHKITPQSSQTNGVEGYKYGNTSKPTNILHMPAFIQYRAMVKAKITRERLNMGSDPNIKPPVININISGSGTITSKSFARRSGNASVDAAAMRAVDRASPLPVPPESIRAFVASHGFSIGF